MNDNRTNTLLLTVIGVATLLVAVIGASFAYFTATLSGEETGTTLTIGAGTMKIAYDTGSRDLETPELIPMEPGVPAITKEFTITGTNTTDVIMPYALRLVSRENTFTSNALTFSLESTNTGSNGTVAPAKTETGIATGAGEIPLGEGFFSGAVVNNVHTYVLKLYFPETNVNQDEDKNKSFAGYVDVNLKEIYTTTS